ncbi:MAG: hypothetical protein ACREH5_04675 [Candidatus Omnitrophota bacterium]
MRYACPIALGLLVFLAATPAGAAEIASSEPVKFLQGKYGDSSLPLTIHFHKDHILPADVTGFNVNARVKVFGRNEGEFEALHSSGWSRSHLVIWIPTKMLMRRGYLQVKVRFDGRDSDIFNVPVLPPPAAPPVITKVEPSNFAISAKSESIYIYGKNIDNYGFSSILVNGKGIFVGNVILGEGDSGLVIGQMPKEYLGAHAAYSVQLATRAGKSSPVNVCVACIDVPPLPGKPAKTATADSARTATAQASAVTMAGIPKRTISLKAAGSQTAVYAGTKADEA